MGSLSGDSTEKLSVLIIGGGIAGFATATGLAQKGHTVTVLESKPGLNEFGASIGILANGVRPLKAWGLAPAFEKCVTKNGFLDIRDGKTSEMLGHIPHNYAKASEIGYGEEVWNINRRDFQTVLAEAAERSGASVVFDAETVKVDVEGCVVHLKDGRTFTGDVIVGADGIKSVVRASIPAVADVQPMSRHGSEGAAGSTSGAYRCTVRKDDMRGNPLLEWLLESGNEYVFLAPGQHLLSWPLPANRAYDVVVGPIACDDVPPGRWGMKGDVEALRRDFAQFGPEVTELLKHIDTCVKWRIAELPPLKTWRSENGRVVLIGDAAHAMLPHAASGGNSAIEDAACLTACLDWASRHHSTTTSTKQDSVSLATHHFQTLRHPRVSRMQTACHEGVATLQSADPAFIAQRNILLAAGTQAYDETLALPEHVRRERPREKADMHAVFPTEPYLQWLYGFDVIADTEAYLAKV